MGCRWAMALLAGICAVVAGVADAGYRIETVATGLEHPWSLAFLPEGRMLVTERAGRLRIIEDGELLAEPVGGVPEVYVEGQAGLFEVLPDPGFADNATLFLSFASGEARANHTRVIRAQFDGRRLDAVKTIFSAFPDKDGAAHFGGRMAFLADGTLLIGLGDGFDDRELAQRLDSHIGTVVRIEADGTPPLDNPYIGHEGALPEIYAIGLRNVQGLVVDGHSGRVFALDHGPRGGDELNGLEPGVNYGWPLLSGGVDYTGARITPFSDYPGMRAPLLEWTPSIAPAGMTLYDGDLFPEWKGSLFVAALAGESVRRIPLTDGVPGEQETLFAELGARIRDVRTGPDGALYLLTDAPDGKLLRVVP